jgi:multiple sugar transport system substrate-binding protein
MKIRRKILFSLLLGSLFHYTQAAELTIFAGGSSQRPDILRKVLNNYQKENPDIKINIETGGATSELQRQYLSTLLSAKDDKIDLFAIDIINPAQYAKAGWLEELDNYLGNDKASLEANYFPENIAADTVNGKLVALPFSADAMLLYYRKDLLEKYHQPVPQTWDQLAQESKIIQKGEGQADLQGLSFQGAPIEGAVCTFLLPYWSQGKTLQNSDGSLSLDKPAAIKSLTLWKQLIAQGVAKKNSAETKTGDTVNEFAAGQVIFGINWGFAWDIFQNSADSKVKNNIGVAALPAISDGKSVSCSGGWQWGVSAFSKNKAQAVKLARYLSSPAVAKVYAIEGSTLSVFPSVYHDPQVLHAVPWFAQAQQVVQSAKARPSHTRYGEISDLFRTQTNAALAGIQSAEQTVDTIAAGLRRIAR